MARIAHSVTELIGESPLLRLGRFSAAAGAELLAKLELVNPSGSDKDRVVRALLEQGEADGTLQPHSVIIEPTSGNIAFSLAMLAVPRGYRLVLVMPDSVPLRRVQLLRAMGAEVVLTPGAQGMRGASHRADMLAAEATAPFRPAQFANPVSPRAQAAIADEIWGACAGEVGAFVASVSTGSTVAGVGRRLKELSGGRVYVAAVQPAASPVLSGGEPDAHRLFGMGPPFVPPNYDPSVVDEVLSVSYQDCHDVLLRLFRQEGLVSGPAGGAAVAALLQLAARPRWAGQRLVTVIPDGMERYAELNFWQSGPLLMPTILDEEAEKRE